MLGQIFLLSVLLLGSLALLTLFWLLPTRYTQPEKREFKPGSNQAELPQVSVQIVVLGDIGHSPRMQNHALSIAKHGGRVSIIGYQCMFLNKLQEPSRYLVALTYNAQHLPRVQNYSPIRWSLWFRYRLLQVSFRLSGSSCFRSLEF